MHSITLADDVAALQAELIARLKRFNQTHAGELNAQHLGLVIRNDSDRIIAGLAGEMFWNVLSVNALWVDEDQRGYGHGRRLLHDAEALARDHGCEVAYLSTFAFQAPGFYAKQGYSRIGELVDVPRGSSRIWLAKRLTGGGPGKIVATP